MGFLDEYPASVAVCHFPLLTCGDRTENSKSVISGALSGSHTKDKLPNIITCTND